VIPNREGYVSIFRAAQASFMHQLVFDPLRNKQVHLDPLVSAHQASGVAEVVGTAEVDHIAANMFYGAYDCRTREPFTGAAATHQPEFNPLFQRVHRLPGSIQFF
jgi:hypothetical protein